MGKTSDSVVLYLMFKKIIPNLNLDLGQTGIFYPNVSCMLVIVHTSKIMINNMCVCLCAKYESLLLFLILII